MDVELLIAEVYSRRPLWQQKHKLHHNSGMIEKLWEEVATALEVTKDAAKTKWKNLKDHFRKELRKLRKRKPGDASGMSQATSNWPFFQLLLFLKGQMTPSKISGNKTKPAKSQQVSQRNAEPSDDCNDDEEVSMANNQVKEGTLTSIPRPSVSHPLKCKRRLEDEQNTATKKFLQLEERKMQLLLEEREEEKSEDYHFFMSLIPHMKGFNSIQKLRIRNKLQQVIIDEASLHLPTSNESSRTGFSSIDYQQEQSSQNSRRRLLPLY